MQPSKPQISLRIRADQSLCMSLEYSMSVKLLTKSKPKKYTFQNATLLEITCLGSYCIAMHCIELYAISTLVKMPHCWKSHVSAHIVLHCIELYKISTLVKMPHCWKSHVSAHIALHFII